MLGSITALLPYSVRPCPFSVAPSVITCRFLLVKLPPLRSVVTTAISVWSFCSSSTACWSVMRDMISGIVIVPCGSSTALPLCTICIEASNPGTCSSSPTMLKPMYVSRSMSVAATVTVISVVPLPLMGVTVIHSSPAYAFHWQLAVSVKVRLPSSAENFISSASSGSESRGDMGSVPVLSSLHATSASVTAMNMTHHTLLKRFFFSIAGSLLKSLSIIRGSSDRCTSKPDKVRTYFGLCKILQLYNR